MVHYGVYIYKPSLFLYASPPARISWSQHPSPQDGPSFAGLFTKGLYDVNFPLDQCNG